MDAGPSADPENLTVRTSYGEEASPTALSRSGGRSSALVRASHEAQAYLRTDEYPRRDIGKQ